MPYSNLILTAGISALGAQNLLGKALREDSSPLSFPKFNPEPKNPELSPEQLLTNCSQFLKSTLEREIPKTEFSKISAEFSMLFAIANSPKGLAKNAMVTLIHTPTLGGRLAAQLQIPLIEKLLGVQCHAHELDVPFDPTQAGGLALASGAFIGTISSLLQGAHPTTTAFAPIGGFKSMVTLGHVAASLHGFPSLYLHEESQTTLHEIAPAPFSLSPEIKSLVAPAAIHIGNGAEFSTLSPEIQSTIEKFPAFFRRIDDLIEVNELGHFLRLSELPILLHPDAHNTFTQNPTLLTPQLNQIRTQALQNPNHLGINHDLRTVPGRNHPWHLAQMGSGVRILWQIYTTQHLLIRHIWTNHDLYEQQAPTLIPTEIPSDTTNWKTL